MGVGISLASKKPNKRWLSALKRGRSWEDELSSAVLEIAKNSDVVFLVPQNAELQNSRLHLNFCEEWLDVIEVGGEIQLSGRTSTCGPGYHALVCDLADYLNGKGFDFQETEEHFDEAGYFASRDFEALQVSHAEWFRSIARHVNDAPLDAGQRISMPIETLVPEILAPEVLTPRGPITREFLQTVARAEGSELLALAATWFPWWNQQPDSRDYRMMGTQLLWSDVAWHVPAGPNEAEVMRAALECFKRVTSREQQEKLPGAEIQEIKKFLVATQNVQPASTGVGYRRHICRYHLGAGWSVNLPGYWYEVENERDRQFCFGDKSLTISLYEGELGDVDDVGTDLFLEENGLHYRLSRNLPEDGQEVHVAIVSRPGAYALITFTTDGESWHTQAREVVMSVRFASEE
jgi:hypothetical protein